MRIAAIAVLLLVPLAVPTASAELECGDPDHPCEVGPCAEFYQDGSAFVVDPGTPECYEDAALDAALPWLAWSVEMARWSQEVAEAVLCGGGLHCPNPGPMPQDPAGILG